jgi:hypothetical protein
MTDNEPGWKNYEDFAHGIGTNRLPALDLTGTSLRVAADAADGPSLVLDFLDGSTVRWSRDGAAAATDPYDAVAVGEHAVFVDLPLTSREREALTVIHSTRTGRALVVEHAIAPEAVEGVPQVGQAFWPATTGAANGDGASAAPAPTRDLIGRRFLQRYSPSHLYEHVYLSSERYAWQCLEGVQRGHGDVDLSSTYKFDDDLYVFCFREFRIPVASLFLYDMKELTSTGRFLGLTGAGVSEHTRSGANIIPLASVAYPDVEPV